MQNPYKIELRPCCWCGTKGNRMLSNICDVINYGGLEKYYIKCRGCFINTGQTSADAAIEAWRIGDVAIPLRVSLPSNHYIKERIALDATHSPRIRMIVSVTRDRGIAEHLKQLLMAVLLPDGKIMPSRFTLDERHVIHQGVTLMSITRSPVSNVENFEFITRSVMGLNMEGNKSDTVWLKSEPRRPPILNKVFEILSQECEDNNNG